MTANERRAEIMRLLVARRSISMNALATELGVTRRTICTDIETLTLDYPLESTMGRNGGVRLPDWYHPHRNILSAEQQTVLSQLMTFRKVLEKYGYPVIGKEQAKWIDEARRGNAEGQSRRLYGISWCPMTPAWGAVIMGILIPVRAAATIATILGRRGRAGSCPPNAQ